MICKGDNPAIVLAASCAGLFLTSTAMFAQPAPGIVEVEGQPLAANALRLMNALKFLGSPLSLETQTALRKAADAQDSARVQRVLDPHALVIVTINPETRVKVMRGPSKAVLQQAGYTPVIVKVVNLSSTTAPLRISSPQAGAVYAGVAQLSMERQRQLHLKENENVKGERGRFLQAEMSAAPPMT